MNLKFRIISASALVVTLIGFALADESLSRGNRIFLEKGFHITAWVTGASAINLSQFVQSNFTCIDKWRDTNINQIPAWEDAGLFWARGTGSPSTDPCSPYYLRNKELPYVSSLLILRWMDEEDMTDPERLGWFTEYTANARVLYPDVLVQSTQWNEQLNLAGLKTFMETANPDMLAVGMYSYGEGVTVYDLKGMYQELEKYRYAGSRGNDWGQPINTEPVPWSLVLDGYQRLGEQGQDGYIKSESFIRHNQFSAWTFGAKCAQWWLYNGNASLRNDNNIGSILFQGLGDGNPRQPTFDQVAETNRQSRNLGSTLIRLKSTGARFVPGMHMGGTLWIWQDDKWGEHPPGSFSHDVPYLVQKNIEDVNLNPLTLSLTVSNGSYEITMTNVYLHGAKDFGGGDYLVTASAEGTNIGAREWNGGVNRTIDIPLAIGPNAIEVNDGQLDITLGNCYTNSLKLGNWFSFEGFRITGLGDLHYSDFTLSYDPPGLETWPVYNDPPQNVPFWDANADPYITDINATNLGTTNDELKGDILVGYFEPLLESFDGPNYESELYFMILNGLINDYSSAAQTQQQIRIDFDFADSGITNLLRLSRDTGQVELVPLDHDTGSQYHLDFILDGGTADLFKFNTGAPFIVGRPYDFDRNGHVGFSDVQTLAARWLNSPCGGPTDWTWCDRADLDYSTTVDVRDFSIFAAKWNE